MSHLKTPGTSIMLTRLLLLLPLILGVTYLSAASAAEDQEVSLNLVIGQIKTIPLTSKVVSVAVGNVKIITSNVLEAEMVVMGEAPGKTSMRLWTADGRHMNYDITVLGTDIDV